jgi:hypothetical protein
MRFPAGFPLLLSASLLVACDSSEPGDVAQLRLLHARDGAPAIDVTVNGETILEGIAFSEASGFAEVEAGAATVALRPAGGGTALSSAAADLIPGTRYTLLFSNAGGASELRIAPDTATGIPLQPPPTEPGDTGAIPGESKIKIRVIHNAIDAPPLDVYLSLDGAPFTGGFPLVEPFTYGVGLNPEFPGYTERDPGVWRVRFTADGTHDVMLDSGPLSMLAGQVRSVILHSTDTTGLGLAVVRER